MLAFLAMLQESQDFCLALPLIDTSCRSRRQLKDSMADGKVWNFGLKALGVDSSLAGITLTYPIWYSLPGIDADGCEVHHKLNKQFNQHL